MSLFKSLQIEIRNSEEKSDRIIPHDRYFVVRIHLPDQEHQSIFIRERLRKDKALAVYHARSTLYLLFSSLNEGAHHLEGKHHLLCSYYTAVSTLFYQVPTECQIIELDSRIKVLVYLQLKIDEFFRRNVMEWGELTPEEAEILTTREQQQRLSKKGVELSKTSAEEKYGTIYKLEGKKITTLSEPLNLLEMEKYTSFFFES